MAESTTNLTSQTSNPLSKKLNKILDNRFDSDKVSKSEFDDMSIVL